MMLTRRRLLTAGACALAVAPRFSTAATPSVEIRAVSRDLGARVFFDPTGLRIAPGSVVRWRIVHGVHTVTACHPANGAFPRRMPIDGTPWDSGYLYPGETFAVRLMRPGVYDYLCRPHIAAGMVGRIVVGEGAADPAYRTGSLPAAALENFPVVSEIL